MNRVRVRLRRLKRRLGWFLTMLWRQHPGGIGGRVSIRTAWSIAKTLTEPRPPSDPIRSFDREMGAKGAVYVRDQWNEGS